MNPEILVVVRASPLRQRTQEVVDSIRTHGKSMVRPVLLSPRPSQAIEGVETRDVQSDWLEQVRDLVAKARCRYFVTASAVDRYLPGAFDAVLQAKADDGQSIAGRALVKIGNTVGELGPRPFRFDYFALLSGYAYVAPGAVFLRSERFLDEGGFDRRFAHAAVYEYLLRTGAACGVSVCDTPVMTTEAEPFPGVPVEYGLLHALDCARAVLEHHRALLPAGATLGLAAMLADQLAPMRYEGYYDGRLMSVLGRAVDLKARWLEYVALGPVRSADARGDSPLGVPVVRTARDRLPFNAFGETWNVAPPYEGGWLKDRVRAVIPAPVWDVLRRGRRAWQAFRRPLT